MYCSKRKAQEVGASFDECSKNEHVAVRGPQIQAGNRAYQ